MSEGKFSEEENRYISENYIALPVKKMARILNRPSSSVRFRMKAMGLVVPPEFVHKGGTGIQKKGPKANFVSNTLPNRFKKEFYIWVAIRARCNNPKNIFYNRYGGRGISVCEEWANSFETFLNDMGPRPDGFSIERKDNDGNYNPANCIWIPLAEQAGNKSTTVWITIRGIKKHLAGWVKITGINRGTLLARFKKYGNNEERLLACVRKRTNKTVALFILLLIFIGKSSAAVGCNLFEINVYEKDYCQLGSMARIYYYHVCDRLFI